WDAGLGVVEGVENLHCQVLGELGRNPCSLAVPIDDGQSAGRRRSRGGGERNQETLERGADGVHPQGGAETETGLRATIGVGGIRSRRDHAPAGGCGEGDYGTLERSPVLILHPYHQGERKQAPDWSRLPVSR